ncbi:acyl-CoA thioesterase [Estrella lausannensis]|uniref:1,4-dihydroxy-2-naphthoyl-CoA hydrolase n=1 Tax=Estrella lausannensis TaxID=483423 RepID=A0A0H5DTC8_9BACT|nr:thioesterase family protein [Estrella lausannensis]CRX39079.1 Conserved hypothetical protein [Estrella lausannensis]
MKFVGYNQVRMHDTDMAGILYFARQFRFVHDAIEDLFAAEGLPFDHLFHKESFVSVIVHCEADYLATLRVGDRLETHLWVEKIGKTSFHIHYEIFRDKTLIGRAKTVHVTLTRVSRKKMPIPKKLLAILERYLLD